MGLPQVVAKIRLNHHLNMLDVTNVRYQLHILSSDKAESLNEEHFYKIIECYDILGDYEKRDRLKLLGKLIKEGKEES